MRASLWRSPRRSWPLRKKTVWRKITASALISRSWDCCRTLTYDLIHQIFPLDDIHMPDGTLIDCWKNQDGFSVCSGRSRCRGPASRRLIIDLILIFTAWGFAVLSWSAASIIFPHSILRRQSSELAAMGVEKWWDCVCFWGWVRVERWNPRCWVIFSRIYRNASSCRFWVRKRGRGSGG